MSENEKYIKIRQDMIQLLVQERTSQNITQNELAKRAGLQRSNLSRFEKGEQNPSLDLLIKIATALGKEPDFILKNNEYRIFEEIPETTKMNGGNDSMAIDSLLKRIDEYKNVIDTRRPLTADEVKELDDYFRIGTTYSSNALEGNTLTISETKIILEDGITIGGKPIKDYYEATGHAKAYDYMLEFARSKDFIFSEEMICRLHKLFYNNLDAENAGIYRNHQVFITGTEYLPPTPEEVPGLMQELVAKLNEKRDKLHPVVLAAFAHRSLVDIHPFKDGNGRTARLLMNVILVNRGYQIVSIPPVLRHEYITALQIAQREKNPSDKEFAKLIAECEIEAQKDYCRMFRIKL